MLDSFCVLLGPCKMRNKSSKAEVCECVSEKVKAYITNYCLILEPHNHKHQTKKFTEYIIQKTDESSELDSTLRLRSKRARVLLRSNAHQRPVEHSALNRAHNSINAIKIIYRKSQESKRWKQKTKIKSKTEQNREKREEKSTKVIDC